MISAPAAQHRREQGTRIFVAIVISWSCLATGCDLPGKPKQEDRYVRPQEVKSFDSLYQTRCAACHGAAGNMGPAPPLNDRSFASWIPEAELKKVITEGRQGTPMPAFAHDKGGELTAEQVTILAQGIKSKWGAGASFPPEAPSYLPEGKVGNSVEGRKVFEFACADCHGKQGSGEGLGNGSPGTGPVKKMVINQRDFLSLISDQALRRIVITGRGDLGMPGCSTALGRETGFQALTSQQVADVVALLSSWRKGDAAQQQR